MLKKIFYIVVLILGIIGLAATGIAVCVSTGISIGTLIPGCAGVIFIAYALIKLLRPGHIIKIKALRIIVTVIVVLGVISFAFIETLIIASTGGHLPEEEVNFVIVPGCGIFPDGKLTLTLMLRLDTAIEYLDEHPAAVCIVSGGQGKNEPVTEASAMKNYLVSKGIDPSRIAEEPDSYDTKENMISSAGIMKTRYAGRQMTAVIVTSGFHIFRSVKLAEYSGIKAYGIPAPTPWYIAINDYMREYIGVIKLYVLDLS
jgi:uncharacterized SAM-binding protein YcdF (DUF218 family)